ncbi:MAG: acyl-CoA dehydrogenase family protein [Actinomycetota bacterium]
MARFLQTPPRLPDAWLGDVILRDAIAACLGESRMEIAEPLLAEVGRVSTVHETLALARRAEQEPPVLTHFGAWGERIDEIRVSSAYEELGRIGVEHGVASLPYESEPFEDAARVVWAAVLTMWGPSSALYSCPIAMTDAAARTLLQHGGPEDLEIVERLTSRDPDRAWTSGQWMTETTGGSDVGRTETVARCGPDGIWRLTGLKWFTSATTSEMALTLARPEGAPDGSRGLGLFRIHRRLEDGSRNAILVRRLKDKLGTRALPTAELELEGAIAHPVGDPRDGKGLKRIATMLNITRLHNALGSAGSMARGLAFAEAYASVREVFDRPLADQPAHKATLNELRANYAAALALALRCAELTGRSEAGTASDDELAALRGLTPVAKLATARWAVADAAEAMESVGGVGYCEDSGLPALVRNTHVLPIWEGTTNVLALDLLRAELRSGAASAVIEDARRAAETTDVPELAAAVRSACDELTAWLSQGADLEASARPFAMSVARTYACARLADQAATGQGASSARFLFAARRLVSRGLIGAPTAPDDWRDATEGSPIDR